MNKKRRNKVLLILASAVILSVALSLILFSLRQNINLYLTPQQVVAEKISSGKLFRLGGVVEKGSVHQFAKNLEVDFVLTDFHKNIAVQYQGILPALFREGQGIIAQGKLNQAGIFVADQVLAKHDENYHPPGVSV